MSNATFDRAMLQAVNNITRAIDRQNGILVTLNENFVMMGRKFNELVDMANEEDHSDPNQMYISDVEKNDSGDYPAEG